MRIWLGAATACLTVLAPFTATALRAGDLSARLRVYLPANATLTIDGEATQAMSDVRYFITAPLQAGKDFQYDLRAQLVRDGREVTIRRTVTVRAGQETVADLNPPGTSRNAGAFYYSHRGAPASATFRPSISTASDSTVGGARDNWKPDPSDPFYPWQ